MTLRYKPLCEFNDLSKWMSAVKVFFKEQLTFKFKSDHLVSWNLTNRRWTRQEESARVSRDHKTFYNYHKNEIFLNISIESEMCWFSETLAAFDCFTTVLIESWKRLLSACAESLIVAIKCVKIDNVAPWDKAEWFRCVVRTVQSRKVWKISKILLFVRKNLLIRYDDGASIFHFQRGIPVVNIFLSAKKLIFHRFHPHVVKIAIYSQIVQNWLSLLPLIW